jgi:thiol-disulfide isomerase/thioredoxin
MSGFLEVVNTYFSPYYYYILFIVSAIIFGFVAKYAYDKFYVSDTISEGANFHDVANADMRSNEVVVYFFYVDWCPHCKTALPEWFKFKNQYDGKEVNHYTVRCVEMNCTDETPEITNVIHEYKIEGYPTVKMLKNGTKIEFDSKISFGTLEQFLNSMSQ